MSNQNLGGGGGTTFTQENPFILLCSVLGTFYSNKFICFLFKCVDFFRRKLMNGIMDTSLLGSFVSYTCVFINVLNWGCERVWRNMRVENKRKENGKVQSHMERNKAAKRKRNVILLFKYNFSLHWSKQHQALYLQV